MKKLFLILLCLASIVMPQTVSAKNYQVNFDCEEKQALDDDTFYKVCHIIITSDFDINHVTGELILKNAQVSDIKTNSDWVNNNG